MAGINHAAVWLAAILHFLFGAAWYTGFSQAWLEGIGKTMEQLQAAGGGMPTPYVVGFIAALGAGMAVGFIGAAIATNYGFEARPLSLWLINTGYVVIGMAIMGAIIAPWRKKKKVTVPLG